MEQSPARRTWPALWHADGLKSTLPILPISNLSRFPRPRQLPDRGAGRVPSLRFSRRRTVGRFGNCRQRVASRTRRLRDLPPLTEREPADLCRARETLRGHLGDSAHLPERGADRPARQRARRRTRLSDFFGFFGALKKGDFFWVEAKKV
jgi:hypothetical protein